ncbi:MAG: hypothetical protein RMK19_06720 [Bacteroidia bacterium]|nr:hypothetical protein [Bacteroidia bacterium]MDW8015688.1 hypothetical protein [Bacteroidia bacterium]
MQALREIEEKLTKWVSAHLTEAFPQVFLVEARLRVHGPQPEVCLRVDTDKGITLDECVKIHLFLRGKMEGLEWLPENFGLSVSSPGIGSPLRLRRQYVQNIGRMLAVRTKSGTLRGRLLNVTEEGIQLRHSQRSRFIPWNEIHTARVELPNSRRPIRSKSR